MQPSIFCDSFEFLANLFPDWIVRYDLNCRIIFVNKVLRDLLGEGAEILLHKTIQELYPDGKYLELQNMISICMETGRTSSMNLTVCDAKGDYEFHNLQFVADKDRDHRIVGCILLGRNLTEFTEPVVSWQLV